MTIAKTFLSTDLTPLEIDRFNALVQRPSDDACWPFVGFFARTESYRTMRTAKRGTMHAHRIAFVLAHGECPTGMTIDHLCENKKCCNPKHMELVTQSENTLRRFKRHPLPRVCKCGNPPRTSRNNQCRECYNAYMREYLKKR